MILSDMADKSLRLNAFIPYRLSFTSTLVSESVAGLYERLFGISVPEWRVIAWLGESDGITQQEICVRTRMDKVTVSRATISLTERGLIDRRPNPQDRRSHLLGLSADGRKLYADIAPRALELEGRIFARFDTQQIETFVSMLEQIDLAVLELGRQAKD